MSRLDPLAAQLLAARAAGRTLSPEEAGPSPASLEEAYGIHRQVAEATGPIGGFKTGRQPGEPQVIAPIFAEDIQPSPGVQAAGGAARIGVELEVGFLVTQELPPVSAEDFADQAKHCVAALCAIEIVGGRLADPDGVPPLVKLADNQVNTGLITGSPVADWQGLDLAQVTARFAFGGPPAFDGPAAVPGGDAFESFCGAARLIAEFWPPLAPGQVVITGALNGLFMADAGAAVEGRIDGLGAVRVELAG